MLPEATAAEAGAVPRTAGATTDVSRPTGQDRRHAAIVITTDGRRVTLPASSGLVGIPVIDRIIDLLLGLVGLIAGSRRENGGTG
jgi:hypothetical protein